MATIDAKMLGIKEPVKIRESTHNVRAAVVFMRDLARAEADGDAAKTDLEQMEAMLKSLDLAEAFVVDMLKLTKAQKEKLEDLNNDDFMHLSGHIAAALMHVNEAAQATEDDQKSNSEPASV